MVSTQTSVPYGRRPPPCASTPSLASRGTFLPPRVPSTGSVASSATAAPGPNAPLGREQRLTLTHRLERLHRRYFDLCETDEQRHDLRTLMHRTVDHLAARGIGWDRLERYFEFNTTLENTRCATAGTGNAFVFGIGGLLADLYAAPRLSAALDRSGIDSTSKAAAMGAVLGTGVLALDGALSPEIVKGMLGRGYVPSDSVRPARDRDAPGRFCREFEAALGQLDPQTRKTATAQLNRSLGPYNTRNRLLVLTPALQLGGVPPKQVEATGVWAQNFGGLAAGAAGALLVASDERKTGHRSPLAYLYRQPADGQDPLEALTTAIHRVEGSSLRGQQALAVGTAALGGLAAIPIALAVPPIAAPTRFGGVRMSDPDIGLARKLVPTALQNLATLGTVAPALAYGAGAGLLSAGTSRFVAPAARALRLAPGNGSPQALAGDLKRDQMLESVAVLAATAAGKQRLYKVLATTAVGAASIGSTASTRKPTDPQGGRNGMITVGGASAAGLDEMNSSQASLQQVRVDEVRGDEPDAAAHRRDRGSQSLSSIDSGAGLLAHRSRSPVTTRAATVTAPSVSRAPPTPIASTVSAARSPWLGGGSLPLLNTASTIALVPLGSAPNAASMRST